MGQACGSCVRNDAGAGPNFGVQIGDVVGSVFTDEINGLGGLSPANALTSGNFGFTTFGVGGTLSHEIGHSVSLSHINKAGSVQPTPGRAPIMGTGAIDLPNQDRITDREFSISGFDGQNGNAPRAHIQQLVDAIGLQSASGGSVAITQTGGGTSISEDGTVDSYSIGLSTVPSGAVTVTATADVESELSLDGTNYFSSVDVVLTGTGATTVFVRAIDDVDAEGAHSSTITHRLLRPAIQPTIQLH